MRKMICSLARPIVEFYIVPLLGSLDSLSERILNQDILCQKKNKVISVKSKWSNTTRFFCYTHCSHSWHIESFKRCFSHFLVCLISELFNWLEAFIHRMLIQTSFLLCGGWLVSTYLKNALVKIEICLVVGYLFNFELILLEQKSWIQGLRIIINVHPLDYLVNRSGSRISDYYIFKISAGEKILTKCIM
jgi:hypothetical protein